MRCTAFVVALAIMTTALPASADSNLVSLGLAYGTEIERPGGHLGYYHAFRNEIDAEYTTFRFGADVDAFFPRSGDFGDGSSKATWWDINGNGHWLFFEPKDFPLCAYLLLGLNLARISTSFTYDAGVPPREEDSHAWKLGGNFGGGLEYRIGLAAIFLEAKYVVSSADQAVGIFGVRFTMPQKSRVDQL